MNNRTTKFRSLATRARVASLGLVAAGGVTACLATAAPASAASCGLSFVHQNYTNCLNHNEKVRIMYWYGGAPGGGGGSSTADYCMPAHKTKNVAVPTSGVAERAVDLQERC
ncbi:MAG: hypothetical protein J2O48_08115 [Solirubrobacterales bacterium]|nr:hypothetical protein [Solirubrobacterales bacterium]